VGRSQVSESDSAGNIEVKLIKVHGRESSLGYSSLLGLGLQNFATDHCYRKYLHCCHEIQYQINYARCNEHGSQFSWLLAFLVMCK